MNAPAENVSHGLFPIDDDDDDDEREPPQVSYISVQRWEQGAKVSAPRLFRGEELPDLQALAELYGGGKYELLARDAGNSRIVAKRAYTIPGPSKPMFGDGEVAAKPQGPDLSELAKLLAHAQQPQSGMNVQSVLALIGVLAPVFQQYLANQAAAQQAQAAAQQNLFAAMISNSNASADKLVAVMGQLYSSAAKPAGGGGSEEFLKGVEWAQELIAGKLEGMKEGEEEPNMKDLMGLAQAWLESQKAEAQNKAQPSLNGAAS